MADDLLPSGSFDRRLSHVRSLFGFLGRFPTRLLVQSPSTLSSLRPFSPSIPFPKPIPSIGPMEPRERDELPSSFLSPRFDPNAKRKRWERTRGNGSPGGSDVDPSPAPPALPRGLVPSRSSMSEPPRGRGSDRTGVLGWTGVVEEPVPIRLPPPFPGSFPPGIPFRSGDGMGTGRDRGSEEGKEVRDVPPGT